MSGLFVLCAVLLVAVVALLCVPLLRAASAPAGRARYDGAVYRDQLEELDRDIARGLIDPAEAEPARLEIQRRLLAAAAVPETVAPSRRVPWLAAAVAVLVLGGSVGVYLRLGSPAVPDEPFALRIAERAAPAGHGHPDMARLAQTLGDKLKSEPNNADGWLLYARTLASLGDWPGSADAYRHRVALGPADAATYAGFGEMLVLAAQGSLSAEARDAFAQALKVDPANPVARFYQAEALLQSGEPDRALAAWQALVAETPDPEMRAEIGRRMAAAAQLAGRPVPDLPPAPAAAAPAAPEGLPAGQSQAMVRGMVAQLAAKLAAAPGDFDGWMRLGRAYAVLIEPDQAADAFAHAADLRPADPAVPLAGMEALIETQKPDAPIPPRAVDLLHRAQRIAPEVPEVLWYLGLTEAQAGHREAARDHWRHLLAVLPADAPERASVSQALAALGE